MKDKTRIGVLALQGAFELHQFHIEQCGAKYIEVKSKSDFMDLRGLILPGGESGVMIKLLKRLDLWGDIAAFRKPIWGICAGAILLAKHVTDPVQESFGLIDIDIVRNAYGPQGESDWIANEVSAFDPLSSGRLGTQDLASHDTNYEKNVALIRAPKVTRVGRNVEVLSYWRDLPTGVRQGNRWATTFHPELDRTSCSEWHQRFILELEGGVAASYF